jgi:Bacterial Ig domain
MQGWNIRPPGQRVVTTELGTLSPIQQCEVRTIPLTAANPNPTPTPIPGSTPTVAITAPAAGATLTGTVTVTASASETGMTIAAVQLQVDGVPLGTGTNASPYTFSLNTANFANGTHSLTATAWDSANVAGNSSPVSVNFSNSNPGNPAQLGVMSGVVPLPLCPVHEALPPGGKVLMVDGEWAGTDAMVWNPVTNIIDSVPVPVNIFCNGMDQMADGRRRPWRVPCTATSLIRAPRRGSCYRISSFPPHSCFARHR